jgi:autotransporter-associated beta strand protein
VYADEPSPLGKASESPVNMEMSNSQLRFSAPIAMGNERGITISGNDTLYALNTVAFSGLITGNGKLIKTGAGKINFTKQNTYSGGTLIKEGIVTFADNNNPLGSGLISFGGGRMTLFDNSGNTETFSTPIDIPTGVTAAIDLDSRMVFPSNLTGGGVLNLFTPFVRADLKGNWAAFAGTINVTTDADGGDFRVTNSYGYGNALVTLGAGVSAYPNGNYTVTYGALASTVATSKITTPFTVGTKNTNASFAGLIQGTRAVTKSGTGAWTLSNANTYTGVTNIDGGSLYVVNTTGSATGTGNVTVKSTGTLGGTCTVSGSVTVQANGTLAPGGTSTMGTLNIGTNLIINSQGVLSVRVNADANTSDVVNVTGATALTGITLNITKSSGTYNAGDKFKILNCSNISATVSQIVPAKPGTNLDWDLTELSTTGTVKVIDAPSALPTELSSDLKIYPNPFDSFLVLNTADIMTYNLRITNVSGQIIYQANNITSPAISIDSSGYKPGMYLVEVTSQGKAAINKVIKL